MKKYKIVIAYDGTDFQGWQVQLHKDTLADLLQDRFKSVFHQEIVLRGASRTDAGVHAFCQIAQFNADISVSNEKILHAWNDSLPGSILIRSLNEASDNFCAWKNVKKKTYYYNLFLKRPTPFISRFGWYYELMRNADLDKFAKALKLYCGEHDFRSFCKIDDPNENTIRTIDSIDLRFIKRYSMLQIAIEGKSFLHFQIRRMVGAALDVARRDDLKLGFLEEMLKNPNSKQAHLRAEASGLVLRKIDYEKGHDS